MTFDLPNEFAAIRIEREVLGRRPPWWLPVRRWRWRRAANALNERFVRATIARQLELEQRDQLRQLQLRYPSNAAALAERYEEWKRLRGAGWPRGDA